MTELFLLGAGASVEAGIPGAYRMTKEMLKRFEYTNYPQTKKVIRFVVGGLLFQQGISGNDPYDGVNIEDLFNAMLLLGERQNSELGPFISSWHPQLEGLASGEWTASKGQDLLETIYGPIEEYLAELLDSQQQSATPSHVRSILYNYLTSSRFASQFKEAVEQVICGGGEQLFKKTAEIMLYELAEMVWITDPTKVNYAVPLVEYAKNTNAVIATLNYDNVIEMAGQDASIEVETGFEAWSNSGEFKFTDGKVSLLKLHGSIDWKLSDGQVSKEKPLPFQVIEKIDFKPREGWKKAAVVFGGRNKLTARGPFLSLLRSFEQKLANSDLLTIIGYSLRDEHINEFIATWFNDDINRKIRIIEPHPENLGQDFAKYLIQYETEDRVKVIKETAANGILSLMKAK
jgi:NAD-dependent SIR2 family protein deacetylase